MKNYIKYFSLFLIILLSGCEEGIDPITPVDPGPDQSAPEVNISFPVEGTKLQVLEAVTSIEIRFEATDDIELGTVVIEMDGNEINRYTDFKDYRRLVDAYTYDNVTNGPHTLTITATDLDGKSTSTSVNFEKEAPYEPKYAGEVLYMPFDNDFIDLVNIERPSVQGSPGFSGESVVGAGSYAGTEGGYLTYPTANLNLGDEFSAAFWMRVNGDPDRAGILVIGPPDEANPDNANNRTKGFRFFRENAGGEQRFKLNVGRGDGDSWFDGGDNADVVPNTGEWVHFAFTISNSRAAVYINGQVAREGDFTGVDWTGCDILSIMSGAPRFIGWNHRSDQSLMDELRIFNIALTQNDIQGIMADDGAAGYMPKYDGESFYVSFDGGAYFDQVNNVEADVMGDPGMAPEAISGDAYAGAEGAYLQYPTEGLLGEELSAAFWLNINATPDRAGILVIGPPDEDNPDAQNNRTSGFRFFRENAGGQQRFKLNVGRGDGDSWFDGGEMADVDTLAGWTHFAFTISSTECVVYINGEVAKQGDFTGVDWTGCDIMSVMSGAPRFTGWGHMSDQSYMDELRLFNKALTQEEIQGIIQDEQ